MRMRFLIGNKNKTFLFYQHIYPFKAERGCVNFKFVFIKKILLFLMLGVRQFINNLR